jgi:hypothetical protein
MSVFFEGNAYIDGGQIQNVNVTLSSIGNCAITTSSLDMNMKNITNVKDPINPQDAATKKYVDDLDIVISNVTLIGTSGNLVSNYQKGSYIITIKNDILGGPSGVFHVTKNEAHKLPHIARTVATPGESTNITLMISWPPNSGIMLRKTGSSFDGNYRVKVM